MPDTEPADQPSDQTAQAPATCPDCGFAWGDLPVSSFGSALVDLGLRYRAVLTGTPDAELRRRPTPEVWSGLEYACHVRDVLLAQRERIYLALVEDRPGFARMNREERVTLARYSEESAAGVADELDFAFALVATALTGRDEADWDRLLLYNFPGPTEHDLRWLGRHTLHECEHHLVDIHRGLAT